MSFCNSTICSVFVNHIIPAIGGITAISIAIAPYRAVERVIQQRSLGDMNTFPFVMMVGNALSWMVYSLILQDYYVMIPNLISYQFGIWYTLSVFKYSSLDKQKQTIKVLCITSIIVFLGGTISFITLKGNGHAKDILGYICMGMVMVFFGSPLTTVFHVIKSKNSESINGPLAFATAVNGILWTVYGLALSNPFIFVPNVIGLLFAIIQIFLLRVFPSIQSEPSNTPLIDDMLPSQPSSRNPESPLVD